MTKSLLSPSFTKFSVESTVIQTKENKTKDVFLRNHSNILFYIDKSSVNTSSPTANIKNYLFFSKREKWGKLEE
jgi:hypothetical protein